VTVTKGWSDGERGASFKVGRGVCQGEGGGQISTREGIGTGIHVPLRDGVDFLLSSSICWSGPAFYFLSYFYI